MWRTSVFESSGSRTDLKQQIFVSLFCVCLFQEENIEYYNSKAEMDYVSTSLSIVKTTLKILQCKTFSVDFHGLKVGL